MPHHYRIYGLQIESSLPLRGLFPGRAEVESDILISWHKEESELFGSSQRWRPIKLPQTRESEFVTLWESETADGRFLRLRYAIEGTDVDFIIDHKMHQISVVKPEALPQGRLKSYLLGSVMSSVLRARGVICLHASVIGLDGMAIAFAGPKTAGKSTTAAAMVKQGASLLTDDIAAITVENGCFHVHSGYMYVRLLRNSVDAVYGESNDIPVPRIENAKSHVRLNQERNSYGAYRNDPLPLACIFLLTPSGDSTVAISSVEAKDRFMALFHNSYGFYLSKHSSCVDEFKSIGNLANTVPLFHLHRTKDINRLTAVCQTIKQSIISLRES